MADGDSLLYVYQIRYPCTGAGCLSPSPDASTAGKPSNELSLLDGTFKFISLHNWLVLFHCDLTTRDLVHPNGNEVHESDDRVISFDEDEDPRCHGSYVPLGEIQT